MLVIGYWLSVICCCVLNCFRCLLCLVCDVCPFAYAVVSCLLFGGLRLLFVVSCVRFGVWRLAFVVCC